MQYFFEFIFVLLIIYALILTFLLARRPKPRIRVKPDIVVVDTSVLIDGRIEGIAKTGFISGTLVVPKFVLEELQMVSDSQDALKRNRGRRGMKILQGLKNSPHFKLEMPDDDYPDIKEVDDKLIALAKEKRANILTVDYNLNRVADIQNIFTLNINELANALKPAVLPGEEIEVMVVQRGKEKSQGVGYLDDGTMVVVEDGIRYMRRNVKGVVSRIFQTDAGRMIFVKLNDYEIDINEERRRRNPYSPRKKFTPPWQKWGFGSQKGPRKNR
jgi:uncharacterized protein YacL